MFPEIVPSDSVGDVTDTLRSVVFCGYIQKLLCIAEI
jgi:hypothetical protein